MRLRVDSDLARITADLPEEKVAEVLMTVLNLAVGCDSPTPSHQDSAPVHSPKSAPSKEDKVPEYKGFLFLQCEECLEHKAFMPKTPISEYKCSCGHITALRDMVKLSFKCECGSEFKYLTNSKEYSITIKCLHCGYPVDLQYHEHKGEYVKMNYKEK